jgi:RNA polymerase subunit RPABC4/transcription elongation factor Spt4
MAQGGQAVGGAFLGAGLRIGGQATQMPGVGPTPPPAPGFAGGGGGYRPPLVAEGNGAAAAVDCPSCHIANAAGAKFCTNCGTALPVAEPHACSQCGNALPPEARFCPVCGLAVATPAGAPAAVPPATPGAPGSG